MRTTHRILTTLFCLFLTSFCSYSWSAARADVDASNKPKAIKTYTYPNGATNVNLKLPERGDPVEMAYQFLELNKDCFRMKDPRRDMVLREVKGDKYTTRVTLKQVYKGIGVDAGARIFFNGNKDLSGYKVTYYDDINLPSIPQIDSVAAWNLVLKDLGFPKGAMIVNRENRDAYFRALSMTLDEDSSNYNRYATHLSISGSEGDGKFHLMWRIWAYEPGHFWGYHVDALNGSILAKQDEIIRD